MTSSSIDLTALGWGPGSEQHLQGYDDGFEPARVAIAHKGSYSVMTARGEMPGVVTGRLSFEASSGADLPAVGDWVVVAISDDLAVIHAVLPRKGVFSRKVAGTRTDEQIVASNVDIVFICTSLDSDLNLRRIERYVTLALQSGTRPVVVLTKSDGCDDVAGAISRVSSTLTDIEVVAVSALTSDGIAPLGPYLEGAPTIALLGSSGVGKSTLVNRLLGRAVMTTREVRDDGKGRHTTTHRRLIPLPAGGALIDTPGMRELQLWATDEGLDAGFSDVAGIAAACRFRDCSHDSEPGCAVIAAVESGALRSDRFESYRKQERELAALARRKDKRLASEEARRWKQISREARSRARHR